MKLFRRKIIGNEVRTQYDVSGATEHYCRKLFGDSLISTNLVAVKFEPEEMKPHITEMVHNYEELKNVAEGQKISSVKFMGKYNNSSFSVVLDYGLSLLNILTDSEDVTKSLVERIDS